MSMQILFVLDKDDNTSEQVETFYGQLRRLGCTWVTGLGDTNEMSSRDIFIGLFPTRQIFDYTMAAMTPRSPRVVGVWNMDGTQQGYHREYDEESETYTVVRDTDSEPLWSEFDRTYYNRYILGVRNVYDDERNVTGTEEVPNDTQIQNWAGWAERDLTDYS